MRLVELGPARLVERGRAGCARPGRTRPFCGPTGLLAAAAAALFLSPAGDAQAQTVPDPVARLELEVRGGLTVGSLSDSQGALDIAPKPSFDVLARVQATPSVAIVGGFFRTSFGCEEGFCFDRDITVLGTHGGVGGEWSAGSFWTRGLLLLGTTRAGTRGPDPSLGGGVHLGAGLSVSAGRFRFLPGASYRWLSASVEDSGAHAVALSLDLGVSFNLRGNP